MKLNYNSIKSNYEKYGEEVLNILYYHYYYIVLNTYESNKHEIDKSLIEEKLKDIIVSYMHEGEKSHNPSKFIHEKMNKFVNNYKFSKLKQEQYKLIISAYSGDINARKKIFLINCYKIDNKALEIYNKYANNDNFLLDYTDIKNIMYSDMFRFTNRFYDRENKGYYFSVSFLTHLRDLTIRIEKHIKINNYNLLNKLKDNTIIDDLELATLDENEEIINKK